MRDIQREIQDSLDAIEQKYNVTILLAIESGSRAWGLASPDSDYDVRFIYMHHLEDYLRLDPLKDTIAWQLDEVLDINGWDLKKALLAFGKGNPTLMEWTNSPTVYRKANAWDSIKPIAYRCFSEKAALHHYCSTANNTYCAHLTGERVSYKKYFYALRPILCCRWIMRYHQPPPMEFSLLLKLFDEPGTDLSQGLLAAVQELLRRKAACGEKELKPQLPVISEFIKTECSRLKEAAASAPQDSRCDFAELNAVFRHALMQAHT